MFSRETASYDVVMFQVLEMYSSGGDLHLELPGGETEGPQALWQIPPYHTKSVMKANFVARMENNHTAYIRSERVFPQFGCCARPLSLWKAITRATPENGSFYNAIIPWEGGRDKRPSHEAAVWRQDRERKKKQCP